MRRALLVISFMIIWSVITAVALTWGLNYNWPDNVHVDYGLPLTWATNTTSTIIGPTDLWSVNLVTLLADLAFWLGIMISVIAATFFKFQQ
jgi:hypothetical protein